MYMDFGHLDKNTLTDLLEQASDHTIVFQQNFEVNYHTLLKFPPPPTLDSMLTMTNLSKDYEWYLNFVGLTFAFALDLGIDQDDYPVLRTLMSPLRDSVEKLASCYNNLPTFFSFDTAIHHWDHSNSNWDWGPSYPG